MARIGVFVCHCGLNIASTVDVKRLVETVGDDPTVAFAADYAYMCSEPGQGLIQEAIRDHDLDGVVVAACSPSMHETTFRGAAEDAGLNAYRLEVANIREQIAWPHQGAPDAATEKAVATVRALVEKARGNECLEPLRLPITKRTVVVGGGVAGLTAALYVADGGYPVVLVERSDRLGGKVAELSSLYLDGGGAGQLLQERIEEVKNHPLIDVRMETEVVGFEGYVGNFIVRVADAGGAGTRAGTEATYDVGAVILATGFDLYPKQRLPEYGAGRHADVVDSLTFERMLGSGEIRRPSDGRVPQEVIWIQCAGSRSPERHQRYCSKICCMCAAKQTMAYREAVPQGQAYVFYIDIRSQGRGYDEYVQQAMESYGVVYLRGKVSRVVKRGERLEVWGVDTLTGRSARMTADLVVLMAAAVPSEGSGELARLMRVGTDENGFFAEAHPKLRPVESLTAGVYLAGASQFPKDISETVAQASGAASKVLKLFAQDEMASEPSVATVDEQLCAGCGLCVPACPYEARELHPWREVAAVNPALCQSCGACAVVCPNKATTVRNMTPEQVLAMVEAIL
jgi:heterodisulfide reductase subunit A